jgi:hypothetical protein
VEPDEAENEDRQLEDDSDREDREQSEGVVARGSDLDVVDAGVVAGEEVNRG